MSTALACTGDCSDDGEVTVDEIVLGVGIAVGSQSTSACPAFDANADGVVTVDELVTAVTFSLTGCPLSAPVFTDVTRAAGIDHVQYRIPQPPPTSEPEYLTGGAAAADYDGDGWIDLYVTRLDGAGILYRNQGDGTFADVTVAAGLQLNAPHGNGAGWADVDNDGDPDLYVTTLGPDQHRFYFFINDGNGFFRDEADARGVALRSADDHYGFSVSFGDYDRDGWVDMHTTEWRPERYNPQRTRANVRLLRNRGAAAPGYFTDETSAAGVSLDAVDTSQTGAPGGFAFASRFADVDEDGWPDLLITGDQGTTRLFWNNRDGTFTDGTAAAGIVMPETGIGNALGDYDGDGRLDWFVSGIWRTDSACPNGLPQCVWGQTGNRLFHNLGNRAFAEVTDTAGVRDGAWGAGATFWDYDNDGDLDLVMTGGIRFAFAGARRTDEAMAMRLWRNDKGRFTEVAVASGLPGTGPGKGLVTFDYDNDGDLDLFVANNATRPVLYRNDGGNRRDWLRVALIGRDSNRDGTGARIGVTGVAGGATQWREVGAGSHFLGQSEGITHFGLGVGSGAVHTVQVDWPATGRTQEFHDVPRNSTLVAEEPPGAERPLFTDVTAAAGLRYDVPRIKEPPHCVVPYDPGMPAPGFECSQENESGAAAAGDYDGDGYVDLYITRMYAGDLLFRNRGDGTFEDGTAAAGLNTPVNSNGAAWGDIDNDGDLDLYVNTIGDTRNYLFINDGHGHFTEEGMARQAALASGMLHHSMGVAFGDYDRDGWLDLYTTEWVWMPPAGGGVSHSRLLRNRGAEAPGFFEDTTVRAGVVLDAIEPFPRYPPGVYSFGPAFVDLDADGWADLALTSDNGTSRLFWNNGDGTFTDGTLAAGVGTSFAEMGSTFADYDGDGDLDWFVTAISCVAPYQRSPFFDCTGNRLYRYDGHRTFSDQTDAAGVRVGHWGWGTVFFDYDNDGDPDLVMVNGMDLPSPIDMDDPYNHDPMRFWRNDGGVMTEMAAAVGLKDTGRGKGILTFDYDGDGDLDLFIVNSGQKPRLYRNDGGNQHDWLRVQVVGERSNRDGYGARLTVTPSAGAPAQVREVGAASHFLGQSEATAHFGLGSGTAPVASVRVEWPASGRVQVLTNVSRNSTLVVREAEAVAAR